MTPVRRLPNFPEPRLGSRASRLTSERPTSVRYQMIPALTTGLSFVADVERRYILPPPPPACSRPKLLTEVPPELPLEIEPNRDAYYGVI